MHINIRQSADSRNGRVEQNITNVTRCFGISIVFITTEFYGCPKLQKNIEATVYSGENFFYFPQALSVNNETTATNKLPSHILVT
jgi:hypothetical protein